jgi:hypothetical protein
MHMHFIHCCMAFTFFHQDPLKEMKGTKRKDAAEVHDHSNRNSSKNADEPDGAYKNLDPSEPPPPKKTKLVEDDNNAKVDTAEQNVINQAYSPPAEEVAQEESSPKPTRRNPGRQVKQNSPAKEEKDSN